MACFPRCRTASISSAGRMWKHTTRYARCSGRNRRSRVDIDTSGATRRRAGVAAIVASAICFGAMAIMARFAYASGVDTITLLALRFGIAAAGAVFLVATLVRGPTWPRTPAGWLAVLGIAIVSTVAAIVLFFAGLERVGPTRAAVLSTVEPVCTVLLAAALLGESVAPSELVGGALILTAVVLLARTAPSG